MPIQIAGYWFKGPFPLQAAGSILLDRSGVYVILTHTHADNYLIADVGESGWVRDRVLNHDRKYCWMANNKNGLYVAVLYCTECNRMAIELQIRTLFIMACGHR